MRLTLRSQADAAEWRQLARAAFQAGLPPEATRWQVDPAAPSCPKDAGPAIRPPPRVPRAFPDLAASALCHVEPARFELLYSLLWRLQDRPQLLDDATDPQVSRLRRLTRAVRRDCHKMHAFLRFRELPGDGRRRFVAWFEPDHHIVARAAPFFAARFADMDWQILTPRGSACFHAGRLRCDEHPAARPDLPTDATEELWRSYYAATFNPARLKLRAMQSEMPRKYWTNLPEAQLIPDLVAGAEARVRAMQHQPPRQPPAFHERLQARRQAQGATGKATPDDQG
ncbi:MULTISPECIES: TIGR03915 family putative DNA repair protein [unclassified Paracoccus (in: a-proteobacteria)]|uniref:TIGR03915 family putative DNA repair protein n=1 Tax=unclassified Paracoccus (in: a-proteobacteria) TaxID=2688777 RepID=UPI0012B29B05|nr:MULTISPECIES: TIGR03915 family putative DNA repair protein [unclassified Paracoccus (in: a-proteobacteria)]UXU74861.1 TIGR03915 family putative DNA repair protein [Paracoccus sp. SMMA_5]UXU80761.1 TIGR03915 family putative DNA repair protein [Paracoccus sp. SMMA_5_TC]